MSGRQAVECRATPINKHRCTWNIEMPAYDKTRRCTRPRADGKKLCKTHLKVAKRRKK